MDPLLLYHLTNRDIQQDWYVKIYIIDIEDSGSEDEKNAEVRSNKVNSEIHNSDEPMDSANQSPKDSPGAVRKMSIGSDDSE